MDKVIASLRFYFRLGNLVFGLLRYYDHRLKISQFFKSSQARQQGNLKSTPYESRHFDEVSDVLQANIHSLPEHVFKRL